MSVPDEIFEDNKREVENKAPIAKVLLLLIALLVVIFLGISAYEKYGKESFNAEDNSLGEEERVRILSEIERAQTESVKLTPLEEKQIGIEIKETQNRTSDLTDEERQKIMEQLQKAQTSTN